MHPQPERRPHVYLGFCGLTVVALVAASLSGFNGAFTAGIGAVVALLVPLGNASTTKRSWTDSAAIYGLLGALGFSVVTCHGNFGRLERDLQPTIDALEAYEAANGEYPESLDDLVPVHLRTLPQSRYCVIHHEGIYSLPHTPPDADDPHARPYHFGCVTFGFYKYSYDVDLQQWYGWD